LYGIKGDDMSKNHFKNRLRNITEEVSSNEIMEALEEIVKEKPDDPVNQFLKSIDFWGKLKIHPLVKKAIDWLGTARDYKKLDAYAKLRERVVKIMERDIVNLKDVSEVRVSLNELKDEILDYLSERYGNIKQGLRHIHAPGSDAKSEGINLYFPGEMYTQETLYRLALKLCSSIVIGDSIGIYSDDEDLMSKLRQITIGSGFGYEFKVGPEELNINEYEVEHPYIVFLKFIFYLREKVDVEESIDKKLLLQSILEKLKYSPVSIFFMPEGRERWCTITLPRLDLFIGRWIEGDSRKNLESLIENIDNFVKNIIKESKKRKEYEKVKNAIDLLMDYYEILCRKLIEYGIPEYYATRNMMDLILDLGIKYDVKVYLKPIELGE
jgi:hypothetical protein